MASNTRGTSIGPSSDRSYFEQQREALLGDIGTSFEQVLANINKLNRSLESIIAVGNEFASVETLWSQFENVMAKEDDNSTTGATNSNNNGSGGGGDGSKREGTTDGVKKEAGHSEDEAMRG